LKLLRRREEIRRYDLPIDPMDLEDKFRELQRLVRLKTEYPRKASYLKQHFDETQRRVLCSLLEEIIELVPWRGIGHGKIFARIVDFQTAKKTL
jgi:hypothetical protein